MRNTSSLTISNDSIVAIATPAGLGAISIIRLSGEKSYQIALALTHRESLKPRYAHLCDIYDMQNAIIEQAIVIFFPKPHSYTTEDVCEIQCHGGMMSARIILELCVNLGARIANAGEFTKRAFLGGRIDLSQAEAISQMIQSHSLEANKILSRVMRGDLGKFIENLREKLLELLAFSEVQIDYSEEINLNETVMDSKLCEIIDLLNEIYTLSSTRQGIIEGHTLSIVGKPNVGKSSLLNALLGENRAIVSDIAGTTRDTIEEQIYVANHIVRVIDTAGIRSTNEKIEKIGIERSIEAINRSDIVLAIFDSSRALDSQDKMLIEILQKCENQHIIIIINKCDLPKICDISKLQSLAYSDIIHISLYKDKILAMEAILHCLHSIITARNPNSNALLLTSSHQLECVKNALDSLKNAKNRLDDGILELFSYEILSALGALGRITREYENEEMLEKMFANFCLGK